MTSGAIQQGVPTKVERPRYWAADAALLKTRLQGGTNRNDWQDAKGQGAEQRGLSRAAVSMACSRRLTSDEYTRQMSSPHTRAFRLPLPPREVSQASDRAPGLGKCGHEPS